MKILHGSSAVHTRGLRRIFSSRKGTVEAVAGVDLDIEQGSIFGFLGPNGAGKTTTLRMLATLLPPTSGEAQVAGFDLRRQPQRVRERIGYVGQQGGTESKMTGRAELVFQGRLYGLSGREAAQRAAELVAAMELTSCADRAIQTYSGGQRRRLDVALGLVNTPSVLFLDEPTTGLDPQGRAHMWDEVKNLRAVGTAVFLTTHYLEEADVLCDRIAIIDHGRIITEGTPSELKRAVAGDVITLGLKGARESALHLLRHQTFVRDHDELEPGRDQLRFYVDDGETAMPAIFRLLSEAGIAVQSAAISRPSLDDVFLLQTGRSLREAAA